MSLQYGFYLFEDSKEAERKAKYDVLSEDDKYFYHQCLPWALLSSCVATVKEDSISVIARRMVHSDILTKSDEQKKLSTGDLVKWYENYLKRFIGFQANVETLTFKQWWKRQEPSEPNKYELPKSYYGNK